MHDTDPVIPNPRGATLPPHVPQRTAGEGSGVCAGFKGSDAHPCRLGSDPTSVHAAVTT